MEAIQRWRALDLSGVLPVKILAADLTSNAVQARQFLRTSVSKAQRFGDAPLTQNDGFVSSFRYTMQTG